MTKKISCQDLSGQMVRSVKVKVIRAPLVDNNQLRKIVFSRARALIL